MPSQNTNPNTDTNQHGNQPKTQPSVSPILTVDQGEKALEFYQKAFDAEIVNKHMTPDHKKVIHATMNIYGEW